MLNSEIEAYTGYGKICPNICVNADFNERYSKYHNWSDVPFPSAKRIRIMTSNGKCEKDLPISGFDLPSMGSSQKVRQMFADIEDYPTSANWFQIYHALNDLAKDANRRYVLGLVVTDNGETLEFIMAND
jgi:hypothetical protein